MPEVSCPLPTALDPLAAQKKLAEVTKRRASLSPAAQERFAARELGVDPATFRAALKGKVPTPKVTSVPSPVTPTRAWNIQAPSEEMSGVLRSAMDRTHEVLGIHGRSPLDDISLSVFKKAPAGIPSGASGFHKGREIWINAKEFALSAEKMYKSGHWFRPKNLSSAESTAVHEIGHDLVELLNPNMIKEAWRGIGEYTGNPVYFGDARSLAKYVDRNRAQLGKLVSRYGAEDGDELMAEMWAMYVDDPTGVAPAIKHFGDTIVKELRVLYKW